MVKREFQNFQRAGNGVVYGFGLACFDRYVNEADPAAVAADTRFKQRVIKNGVAEIAACIIGQPRLEAMRFEVLRDCGRGNACCKCGRATFADAVGSRQAARCIRRHSAEISRFRFDAKATQAGRNSEVQRQNRIVPLMEFGNKSGRPRPLGWQNRHREANMRQRKSCFARQPFDDYRRRVPRYVRKRSEAGQQNGRVRIRAHGSI